MKIKVFMAHSDEDSEAIKKVMQEYGDWISENSVDIKHMSTDISEVVFPGTCDIQATRYFTYVLTIGYVEHKQSNAE